MARQGESALRPNRPIANTPGQNVEAQEINSIAATNATGQDDEPLNEEQRRELIATIWREMYGPESQP